MGASIDHGPFGQARDDDPALDVNEVDPAPVARAAERVLDPGDGGHRLFGRDTAAVIDLMTQNHRDVAVHIARGGHGEPVRHRGVLDPDDPDRIVHMAEFVDVLVLRLEAKVEPPLFVHLALQGRAGWVTADPTMPRQDGGHPRTLSRGRACRPAVARKKASNMASRAAAPSISPWTASPIQRP